MQSQCGEWIWHQGFEKILHIIFRALIGLATKCGTKSHCVVISRYEESEDRVIKWKVVNEHGANALTEGRI